MYFKVSFLTGKYYAAEVHDPSSPEWPPHPSRLFSALVASAYSSKGGLTRQKKQVLEWLESLDAPAIAAASADTSKSLITYVPPGDIIGQKGGKGEEQYEHAFFRWCQPRYFPSAVILGEPSVYYGWPQEPDENIFSSIEEITTGITHIGTTHSMAVVSPHLVLLC